MKACVVLTSSESKRLIGKAVASMDIVKRALDSGIVIILKGTTNSYVAEEILGKSIDKGRFARGIVTPKGLTAIPKRDQIPDIVIDRGRIRDDLKIEPAFSKRPVSPDRDKKNLFDLMKGSDVVIKGANALDPTGVAGIYLHESGGTTGIFLGPAVAKGVNLIIPVGLEKLIPTPIKDFASEMGRDKIVFSMGMKIGIMPIMGNIVTEIEAFKILSGAQAINVGAGGVYGAEGARIFLLKGSEESVKNAFKLVKEIKGEPPYRPVAFLAFRE